MVDRLDFGANRLTITKNDKVTFDSNAPSVQLFPDNTKISLTNKQIVFPNFLQGNAYHRFTGGAVGINTYCESWSTLFYQEWGPTEGNYNEQDYQSAASTPGPSTRNLPQEFLGTVPPETDYLDVRVRLTRTKLPAVMWSKARPYLLFQEGQWINLPGGSCPTEEYFPMFIRQFDIVREVVAPIGGVPQRQNIWLRRYQSVRKKGTTAYIMPSGGPIIDTDANVSGGWTVGEEGLAGWNPTGAKTAPAREAWLACLIETKGPDSNGGKRRKGTSTGTANQCAIPGLHVAYPDLGSIYTGDITIHPGRYE